MTLLFRLALQSVADASALAHALCAHAAALLRGPLLSRVAALLVGSMALVSLVRPEALGWFGACPFERLSGLHCPSCKLTEALHHAVRFEVVDATASHTFGVPLALLLVSVIATCAVVLVTGRIPKATPHLAGNLGPVFAIAWLAAWVIEIVPQ